MKFQPTLGRVLPLVAASAITLIGCAQLPFSTTPGATTPQLSGRVTFNSSNPGQALTLGLKMLNGTNYQKLTNTAVTDTSGNYGFSQLNDGQYQVFYDDQGQDVTDPTVNTMGVYNSEPATVASGSATTASASISFDVAWPFAPTIKPYDTYTVGRSSFGFAGVPAKSDAEYQVLVSDLDKKGVWSSDWAAATSFTWNGKSGTGPNASGTYGGVGRHYYLIKFRKTGTQYGGVGYYGQTKWVPFTVARP